MHKVRCEVCGKVLGIITDEIVDGTRVFRNIETVFLGDYGFMDGDLQASGNTYCEEHKPQSSNQTAIEE